MNRPVWLTLPELVMKPEALRRELMKPANAKPVLAGILGLLLVVELLLPGAEAPPPHGVSLLQGGTADQGADAAINQWGTTALARPLFNATRRPVDDTSATVTATPPRLCAIIVIGGTRSAIFAPDGGKPVVVGQGGDVGPYHVTAIAQDSVDVLGPDGAATLRPQSIAAAAPAPQGN